MTEHSHDNKGTQWVKRVFVGWTDEQTERLKELRAKGLSATEIGLLLNRPRNSVIGKLWRAGIEWIGTRPQPRAPREPKPRVRKFAERRPTSPRAANRVEQLWVPPLAAPPTNTYFEGVAGAVEAITATECHWPLPDGPTPCTGFCRAVVANGPGQPYCAYHRHVSQYGPPR